MLRPRLKRGALRTVAVVAIAAGLAACSDDALLDVGGRSGGWIGAVATTGSSTTTTVAALTRPAVDVVWSNDTLGDPPEPDDDADLILARIFARAGNDSRFLQSTRDEIAALVPEASFPGRVPAPVSHISSQVVIESRTLRLANDPLLAFGLWSVEPYTRSRSIGQVAVMNVYEDATAAEVANDPNSPPTCTAFAGVPDRVCGIESFADVPVWRLETQSTVTHLFYVGNYRYEIGTRPDVDEEMIHEAVMSMGPLVDLLEPGEVATTDPSDTTASPDTTEPPDTTAP